MSNMAAYILYAMSALIIVAVIYYLGSMYIDCADKGGFLVRTVWTGWKCAKLEVLK